MSQEPYVLGVLGGMGTYATIHLFKQYAKIFPAHKEWDRPRLLIDNNCTMPSRVRAVLYNEGREALVQQMADSLQGLIRSGATRLLLGCNTSHLFLEEVYEKLPQARERVVHIIDACVEDLKAAKVSRVYLLATEGTLLSQIYQRKLEAAGILCDCPAESEFPVLRDLIEAVKQDAITPEACATLAKLISRAEEACILGCTELPVLYDQMDAKLCGRLACKVVDPLYVALEAIHQEWAAEE
ncbi:MAG: aspartate/glutamate racemase family protein [Clostridia bacterium]|nr:aspartate/glutamate racemase family protein [Clostridia bacterium]